MKNISNYKNFLNEGISPGVKKARKALADGKKVFARHTHPRLSGKEFEILSFSPTGAMAEVMWSDGKKPEDMASFSIDDNKIRIEESVKEAKMGKYHLDMKIGEFDVGTANAITSFLKKHKVKHKLDGQGQIWVGDDDYEIVKSDLRKTGLLQRESVKEATLINPEDMPSQKGSDMARKTIGDIRKKFRSLTDDEVRDFIKDLAFAFDLDVK